MQTYKELIRVLSVQGNRDESGTVDMAKATKEANDLFQVKRDNLLLHVHVLYIQPIPFDRETTCVPNACWAMQN